VARGTVCVEIPVAPATVRYMSQESLAKARMSLIDGESPAEEVMPALASAG
jgi:hypothetical protein